MHALADFRPCGQFLVQIEIRRKRVFSLLLLTAKSRCEKSGPNSSLSPTRLQEDTLAKGPDFAGFSNASGTGVVRLRCARQHENSTVEIS
jgi:hypothetical protein